MSNVVFTQDIHSSIVTIAYELELQNKLKLTELYLQYGNEKVDKMLTLAEEI